MTQPSKSTKTLRTHKIELDVTNREATMLARHCGLRKLVWNRALEDFKSGLDLDEWLDWRELQKRWTEHKRTRFPWAYELHAGTATTTIKDLGAAIKAWRGTKDDGSERKKRNRFPSFKKRCDSFRASNGRNTVECECKRIRLPKIGWLRMREELRFSGDIVSCVVSRRAGRWYVAITVETDHVAPQGKIGPTIGVDLGIKTLAVCSDGIEYANPKALRKRLKQMARVQRVMSRRKKGSHRRSIAKQRVAKLHKRIADLRNDYHHKVTTEIAQRAAVVSVETLNIKGMMKNRRLSRAFADAGLAEFVRQLEYKCGLYGTRFVRVDRWYPSTQLCSRCGRKNDTLTLAIRTWTCNCGAVLDRDANASKNIEREGARILAGGPPVTGRGRHVRPEHASATASEAPTAGRETVRIQGPDRQSVSQAIPEGASQTRTSTHPLADAGVCH